MIGRKPNYLLVVEKVELGRMTLKKANQIASARGMKIVKVGRSYQVLPINGKPLLLGASRNESDTVAEAVLISQHVYPFKDDAFAYGDCYKLASFCVLEEYTKIVDL